MNKFIKNMYFYAIDKKKQRAIDATNRFSHFVVDKLNKEYVISFLCFSFVNIHICSL